MPRRLKLSESSPDGDGFPGANLTTDDAELALADAPITPGDRFPVRGVRGCNACGGISREKGMRVKP